MGNKLALSNSKAMIKKIFTFTFLLIFFCSSLFGQDADSIHVKKTNKKTAEIISIAVPSAMITYGLISLGDNGIRKIDHNIYNSIEQNNRFWNIKADNYIQYAPVVAAYAMKFCKVESTHNLLDMTIIYAISSVITGSIVQGSKSISHRTRPNGSNNHSFPSGHTAVAFVAAEFLHQEYKDKSTWISIGGYTAATFVGIARIYNNKHWFSDVLTGAGIGILTTKAVYWVYPNSRKKSEGKDHKLNTFFFPEYSNGNFSLALSHTF